MTEERRIQQLGMTAAEWAEKNPVLLDREMGIETDTRKAKYGDGIHDWNTLRYAGAEVDLTPYPTTKQMNEAIKQAQPDLTPYATKQAVTEAFKDFDEDLSKVATSGSYNDLSDKPAIPSTDGLASEQWVKDQKYLTEHQDLSNYATKSDIQNYQPFGAETVGVGLIVRESGGAADPREMVVDTDVIASKQWVESKNYLTEHQDLSDYAKKSDIPSTEGLATTQQLNQHTNDTTVHVTQAEKNTWSGKQDYMADSVSDGLKVVDNGVPGELVQSKALVVDTDIIATKKYVDEKVPTVNDATISIKQNGEYKGAFTLNEADDYVIELDGGAGDVDWADVRNKPNLYRTIGDWEIDETNAAEVVARPDLFMLVSDYGATSVNYEVNDEATAVTYHFKTFNSNDSGSDNATFIEWDVTVNTDGTKTQGEEIQTNIAKAENVPSHTEDLTFTFEDGSARTITFYTVER